MHDEIIIDDDDEEEEDENAYFSDEEDEINDDVDNEDDDIEDTQYCSDDFESMYVYFHYFDLQRYHNTEYWEDIKQGIQSDCANRYKDRKTKLKKHFDKVGGYDNTERAKTKPPEGMNPDAWVRVIEELFTTPTYQKRSQANSANRSKQLYGSYHGTQSYAQRRYTEVQETGAAKHVESLREMHCKGSSGWYNELAETHWGKIMDEKNKSMSSSGGDDMPVNEVEILERSLG
ncbi:hypothetical protein R6Q57_020484 [Mikania cordata]